MCSFRELSNFFHDFMVNRQILVGTEMDARKRTRVYLPRIPGLVESPEKPDSL